MEIGKKNTIVYDRQKKLFFSRNNVDFGGFSTRIRFSCEHL